MRNSFKNFFFVKSRSKFYSVRFVPAGYNSPLKLNLFSNSALKKDSIFNSMIIPLSESSSKSFYSSFSYKYFVSKWSKFEEKSNYFKYIKSPSQFPNFTRTFNYFSNAFLRRRKLKRFKRKSRTFVIFRNKPARGSSVVFRAYQFQPSDVPFEKEDSDFYDYKKKLLSSLAVRKSFKSVFGRYWMRRRKFYFKRGVRNFRKFYFKKRDLSFRLFKYFKFRKIAKKLSFSRRYAFRKFLFLKYFRKLIFSELDIPEAVQEYPIPKFHHFRKIARKLSVSEQRFFYTSLRSDYRIRQRVFVHKFGSSKLSGFRDFLFFALFGKTAVFAKKGKSLQKAYEATKVVRLRTHFSIFKSFRIYKYLRSRYFRNNFRLNIKNYHLTTTLFRSSQVQKLGFNFIPFSFKFEKLQTRKFTRKFAGLQFLQRRKLIRFFRFLTYFSIFLRSSILNRGTVKHEKFMLKFIQFMYLHCFNGNSIYVTPFTFNKFFYSGFISHLNCNVYFRDPTKFNNFGSSRTRRKTFVLKNNI